MSIYSISLKNFKSIREATDIRFGAINVLIGPNGAGKSNLISFFKLLNKMMNKELQTYVKTTGRANSYLYFGAKKSPFLEGELIFQNNVGIPSHSYHFKLLPTQDGGFIFDNDAEYVNIGDAYRQLWSGTDIASGGIGTFESTIPDRPDVGELKTFFQQLRIFHFHDTSQTALIKGFCNINDNAYLKEDARNLAAFLYKLSKTHPQHFSIIEKTIQSVAPFFNRFDLRPTPENEINLSWLEKGSDDYFDANHLSDGTLRFICLATLLLQPEPPETIIIDEPELGLHPYAIDKLAAIIHVASAKTQIIISTQSVNLLNNFAPEDIIVVERENEQSTFKRLESIKLEEWLDDYTIGELWDKNVIGGRPR